MKKSQQTTPVDELRRRFEQANLGSSDTESLYAQVKKTPPKAPNRRNGPEEPIYENLGAVGGGVPQDEVLYADVRHQRGRHQGERSQDEVLYADVRHQRGRHQGERPQDEVLYADVRHQRGRHQGERSQDEVLYADVRHQRGRHQGERSQDEVLYADVRHQRGRHQGERSQDEVLYADVRHQRGRYQEREQEEETSYTTVSPRGRPAPRSEAEIMRKTQHDPLVKAYGEEVEHWCGVVFGNKDALQEKMKDILKNPSLGAEVSKDLLENPQSVGDLAGKKRLGMKSHDRKEAEKALGPLSDAVKGYADAAKRAQEQALRTPGAQDKRLAEAAGEPHHRQERGQHVREQEQHQRRHAHQKGGMAFAM